VTAWDAATRLSLARLYATHSKRAPYLAAAMYALIPVEVPAGAIGRGPDGTLAVTDRGVLLYEAAAIQRWTTEELAGVLVHEVHHLLRVHHVRAKAIGAEPELANIAEDMEINDDLRSHWQLPDGGGVQPEHAKLAPGLAFEEYYRALQQQQGQGGQQGNKGGRAPGSGACGGCAGNPGPGEPAASATSGEGGRSDAELARVRRATAEAVRNAVESHGRGSVPAGLQRWADGELAPPKVRWQDKLRRAVRRGVSWVAGNVDLRHMRPSRRQAGLGYGAGCPVLAAPVAPIPRVCVAVDTSGSMGSAELNRALSELRGILSATGVAGVEVLACDAAVHGGPKHVRTIREAANALHGGGGTDFCPVFDELAHRARARRPAVLVFITDGDGACPTHNPLPDVRTIWVLVGANKRSPCSWGEQIAVDEPP
jgi:predicted metal-dependent peptidase